jgi:hypothetical protein
MKYQFSTSTLGIHVFLKTTEACAFFVKIVHNFDQVFQESTQAIKAADLSMMQDMQ